MFVELRALKADFLAYREVLFNIVSQDLKVKYKRTALGYFWSLLNPLLQLAVLTTVFSRFVGRGMKDYALYLFSGLIAWSFFQNSLINASTTLLENEGFIKKIYLPKIIFPVSRLCLRGVDFLFSLLALTLLGILFGFPFHPTFVLLPAAILFLAAITLGFALIVCVLTVYFRDVQYLLTIGMQLWYFATPILYPSNMWPEEFAPYFRLNPMYWQIELFHKLIYYGQIPSPTDWAVAGLVAGSVLCLGLAVLIRCEKDLIFHL